MEDFSRFRHKDMYLTAVLIASGCVLEKLEKQPGDFVEFVFQDPPEKCHEIIASYWANELSLNPKDLIEAINEVKTRLHSRI